MTTVQSLTRALLGGLFQSPVAREREFFAQYRALSGDIAANRADLTPRVLRGELLLERRDYERAHADFKAALAIAGELDGKAGWQIAEQVMRDRALYGMEIAARKLPVADAADDVEA